ncbi:LacI family DNA-binding transcriptional regulator [Geminisphaera colitermitum]|uniref:LacI family DNA-binding transcriptional regulator n=1 Tax=Geminisphaera colitermitum TaxID=1148786 RepID=UPI000158C63F|nr:LacI family DNA-binding transcriptional regulator [Geminisphaera colitermitum]RRK00404.1 LacI family transcriptional regulator [Opitutaceae bacterium TAV3]
MPPTVYDLCEKSGFSIATVSRVFNGSSKVSDEARRKVLAAADALGYSPSFAARSLARKRSDLVGAIFPRMASGFFADVLCGLDAAVKVGGFHLLTAFSHGADDERELAERFVQQRLVGALIVMNFQLRNDFLARLGKGGVPVVSLDGPSKNLSSVSIDNASGMRQLLEHVAALGHRRLAVLPGRADAFDSNQRLESCRAAADSLGLEIPDGWCLPGGFTEAGGYEVVQSLLARGARPTVIAAFNDLMAFGAIRALREAGLRVPEDVSVTGFDDIELAAPYNLTTVRVPMFELGKIAGEAALAHLNGERKTINRVVEPRLVRRGSSARASLSRHPS